MDMQRIEAAARTFFDWPDPARRDHVTLLSCLLFAQSIAQKAVHEQQAMPFGPDQFMIVAAFRYCLGRQTYIVHECADWLLAHWGSIEQPVRSLIQRELERAFESDDKARAVDAQGCKPLGWDCDRQQWERVLALWSSPN